MSTNWDDAPTLSDVVHSIICAPGMVRHDNGVRGGVGDSATLVLHSLFENLTFPQSFFCGPPSKKNIPVAGASGWTSGSETQHINFDGIGEKQMGQSSFAGGSLNSASSCS